MRILALILLACLLVLVLVGLPQRLAPERSSAPRGEGRVRALLERAQKEPKLTASLEESLVALGIEAAPEIEESLDALRERNDATAIARALARLKKDGALPALLRLAKAESPETRQIAAAALPRVATKDAVPPLLSFLADESTSVGQAAVGGLVELDQAAPRLQVRAEVARLFDRGRVALARVRAAECLVRFADRESVSLLERALRDLEADVRAASADALGRLGSASEDARAELVEMLQQDREIAVRKQAALALGRLKERSACPALIELLSADDAGLRGNALWSLRSISGYAFPSTPERWAEWWKRDGSRPKP